MFKTRCWIIEISIFSLVIGVLISRNSSVAVSSSDGIKTEQLLLLMQVTAGKMEEPFLAAVCLKVISIFKLRIN